MPYENVPVSLPPKSVYDSDENNLIATGINNNPVTNPGNSF